MVSETNSTATAECARTMPEWILICAELCEFHRSQHPAVGVSFTFQREGDSELAHSLRRVARLSVNLIELRLI